MAQELPPPIETEDQRELAEKLLWKLTRKQVVGKHKKQIATVINWVATHEQGRAKKLIKKMNADPNCPLEYYNTKEVIRLSSYEAAVNYLDDIGGDTEWL